MRAIVVPVMCGCLLAGCGDPLRDMPRLSETDLEQSAGGALAQEAPEGTSPVPPVSYAESQEPRGGLLGILGRRARTAQQEGSADASGGDDAVQVVTPPTEQSAQASPRRGLMGRLMGGGGEAAAPARGPAIAGPDLPLVSAGERLPFGEVGRLCGSPALGQEVEQWPENRPVYRMIDSQPSSTSLRTFYITGFDDGCARQFSAALALFGDPALHEQIRYGAPADTQPSSETDSVYEKVKARVCRVASGEPCGDRIDTLAKDTVFVSVYDSFGGSSRWKNLLLHDGELAAFDMKSR